MADSPLLPGSHSGPVDPRTGLWKREWYGFLRDLVRTVQQSNGNTADLTALLARIVALEEAPPPDLGQIFGDMSVDVQGLLGQVVQLRLIGDAKTPGTTYYYGTNADGTKGWHAVADALAQVDGIALTVDGTTGVITIGPANDLAAIEALTGEGAAFRVGADDWALRTIEGVAGETTSANENGVGGNPTIGLWTVGNTAAGTLLSVTVDLKGRVIGYRNTTTADLTPLLSGTYQPLIAFAANQFGARASTGAYGAKTITDDALLLLGDATVPRLGTANTWALTQTFSLAPIVSSGAVNALFVLDANAGTAKRIVARSGGVNRLQWGSDGSDNYVLNCYDNAGASLGMAYTVDRLTRVVTFPVGFVAASADINGGTVDGTVIGASSAAAGTFTSLSNSGAQSQDGVESPAAFGGNVDNLAIASTTRFLRIQSSAGAINLTGIVAPTTGRLVRIINIFSADITLVHNATSTAANQFRCPGGVNLTLQINDSVEIWYDLITARWRVLGF